MEQGPISALLEAAAAAVGVGMVLGGFFAGLVVRLRRARHDFERDVVDAGYVVAAVCLLVRLAELVHTI